MAGNVTQKRNAFNAGIGVFFSTLLMNGAGMPLVIAAPSGGQVVGEAVRLAKRVTPPQ